MNLRKFSILIVSASLMLGVSSCPGIPEFKWTPNFYVGDARTASVVRSTQDGQIEQIHCSDVKFDQLLCFHNSEPRLAKQAYFDVVNQCSKWKQVR